MTHNPEKRAPVKINLERIKLGLSERQMNKIKYECDLLRKDMQEMLHLAPHLFTEGVTAANTSVIEAPEEAKEKAEEFTPSAESQSPYGYYSDYDDSDYPS